MKIWIIIGSEYNNIFYVDAVAARYEAEYKLFRLAEQEENIVGQLTDLTLDKGQLLITDNEYEPHLIKTYQIYEKDIDF